MSLEQAILKEIQALPPEKQREIYDHARRLRAETAKKPPFKSVRGMWAHLGISLSPEESKRTNARCGGTFPEKTSDARHRC